MAAKVRVYLHTKQESAKYLKAYRVPVLQYYCHLCAGVNQMIYISSRIWFFSMADIQFNSERSCKAGSEVPSPGVERR